MVNFLWILWSWFVSHEHPVAPGWGFHQQWGRPHQARHTQAHSFLCRTWKKGAHVVCVSEAEDMKRRGEKTNLVPDLKQLQVKQGVGYFLDFNIWDTWSGSIKKNHTFKNYVSWWTKGQQIMNKKTSATNTAISKIANVTAVEHEWHFSPSFTMTITSHSIICC